MPEPYDFDRSLKSIEGVSYFVTICLACGACFASRTIGNMPPWEGNHANHCPAPREKQVAPLPRKTGGLVRSANNKKGRSEATLRP